MIACRTCGARAVVQWARRLPGDTTSTEPVYACAAHALTPECAGYVHDATCTGPSKDGACSCPAPAAPEFPFSEDDASVPKTEMPPGW
ncbi:hypothetical protein OG264_16135 [Streptomyces xanthophaeus]|uniref:hypothetical protein n=1 Tax=Streptomyces xanthophaeus TaxID=67385 RepID=UPI00386B34C1|nr:hypothetical protein OG264_16135 [Streptomyces xanthophaeus]WST62136.1 hypothetical protein OG605_22300 [Streptomyces xanthophaeus]